VSIDAPITAAHKLFVSEQRTLRWEVKDEDDELVETAGWTVAWELRDSRFSHSPLIELDGAAVAPHFVEVDLDPEDFEADGVGPGSYYYVLHRTNVGNETVLAFGDVELRR
jgi:hypothetical protein